MTVADTIVVVPTFFLVAPPLGLAVWWLTRLAQRRMYRRIDARHSRGLAAIDGSSDDPTVVERLTGRDGKPLVAEFRKDTLDGGWTAECPDLPGCTTVGDTLRQARHNLRDAIREFEAAKWEQNHG